LNVPDEARVIFHHDTVMIEFSSRTFGHAELHVEISCGGSDWQLSSLTQVCALCLPPLSTVEILRIEHLLSPRCWKNGIEDAQWLDLLRPFNGAKGLHLSRIFVPGVGSSLKELTGDRITEVLPTLQNIFADRYPRLTYQELEGIQEFVNARCLSGHPIIISLKGDPPGLDCFKAEHVRDIIPPLRPQKPRPFVANPSSPDPDPAPKYSYLRPPPMRSPYPYPFAHIMRRPDPYKLDADAKYPYPYPPPMRSPYPYPFAHIIRRPDPYAHLMARPNPYILTNQTQTPNTQSHLHRLRAPFLNHQRGISKPSLQTSPDADPEDLGYYPDSES
jgi:hypothetical protein